MGIGAHVDFQGFSLITRATYSFFEAGSQSGTIISGDYYDFFEYGTTTISNSWEYNSSIGMINHYNGGNLTYYFSDEENGALFATKYTTTQSGANLLIASTTTYEATTQYVFLPNETISTSWSDKSISYKTRNRNYTIISSIDSKPYGIDLGGAFEPVVICQNTNGLALIFEPLIGTDWSVDGSALNYYQLFTNTGTYSNTYGNIFFDKDLKTTIFAETSELVVNTSSQQGSTESLTYAYTSYDPTTITITKSPVETIINGQTYLTSSANQTVFFNKVVTESSSSTYILADEFTETASTGDVSVLVSEKIIAAKSTAVHYVVDNAYTYNTSFTYSGLIDTTQMYSYTIFSQSCGSHSETYTYETTSGEASDPQPDTSTHSLSTIIPLLTNTYFVNYYSILLGTSNSEWNKYYYQKYPVNPFAVAFTAESANRYKASISGESNVIFTSYKFDILNDFYVSPKLYIPINATEYSYDTNTSYYTQTIQAVSIPSNFYYGLGNATVSRTTLTSNSIALISSNGTQEVGYAGVQTTAVGGHVVKNDFENDYWNPPFNSKKIMHTIGVLGTGSADYKMDGYFVYNSVLNRTVVGDSVNPISIIGNGQATTVIASMFAGGSCFPYVSNLIAYANSYK